MSRIHGIRSQWTILISLLTAIACEHASPPTGTALERRPQVLTLAVDWNTAANLGAALNAGSSELQLGIAPNGRSLYVSSDRAGTLGGQDLWVSRKQADGSWAALVNLGGIVNSPALESSPTLTIDGRYLYFSSRRTGLGGLDCWRSFRDDPQDDFAWQAPENLGPPVNSIYDDADCVPRRPEGGRETLWFTSFNRPGGQGDYDIYTSEIAPDGTFGPATPVVELNTPFRDTRMTLPGNALEVIFASNRAGGLGGIDLWIARRESPNHPFCPPENLGLAVNSTANDRSPSISTNGAELYFTSTRTGGFGNDDVYLATRAMGHGSRICGP